MEAARDVREPRPRCLDSSISEVDVSEPTGGVNRASGSSLVHSDLPVMQIANMFTPGRLSGILLPVFSLRSRSDFGIGDFGALPSLFRWMQAARQRMLVLLPLLPTLPGDASPYATRSAFGLNPFFIDLGRVPELAELGQSALSEEERQTLERARDSTRIRYDLVFPLKRAALRRAFERFEELHWRTASSRAAELRQYLEEQGRWLDSFSLFCAISDDRQNRAWWEWPEGLRTLQPASLALERERLGREILFHVWQQWIAEVQWREVRKAARDHQVILCGDEPFIVAPDSRDTWAHQDILRRDARLGVPPDDFSAVGQDWGLPYFDFEAMKKDDFAWLRARAARTADYYELRRIDHAVGYFRQWIRNEKDPNGHFIPAEDAQQRAQGEQLFRMLSGSAGIVAEDLGVIPDFVRETLTRLSILGYRVLRWERDAGTYRNPHHFPELSLATTSTHDTETLREWWETQPPPEREAVIRAYPELQTVPDASRYTEDTHRALLAAAENSGSDLCVVPWQDAFGTRERINLPGSISGENWAYRIETPVDELLVREDSRATAALLARLTEAAGR
jgi:4-alpha-glucanotransferase